MERGSDALDGDHGTPTRERILAAAEEVFAASGFSAGTTRRIAERADVPEGLIFHYFGTKRGVLDALFAERSLGPELSELAAEIAREQDPRRLLLLLGRRMYEGLGERESVARIILTESYLDEAVRTRLQAAQQERIELIAQALDDATPRSLDHARARTIAQVFLGSILFAIAIDRPEDPEAFLASAIDVLLGPALES